jgi:hypothetical protein
MKNCRDSHYIFAKIHARQYFFFIKNKLKKQQEQSTLGSHGLKGRALESNWHSGSLFGSTGV